jgi:hypothetical protein
MNRDEPRRGAQFRIAYWDRTISLAGLVNTEGQQQMLLGGGEGNLWKKQRRQIEAAVAAHSGSLTLGQADEIAKRYALWTVRYRFDWGRGDVRKAPIELQKLDKEICENGIWKLDVVLRKKIEKLLLRDGEPSAAVALRHSIETEAGRLAANLEQATLFPIRPSDWAEVVKYFDPVCNELNNLLTEAGSPIIE